MTPLSGSSGTGGRTCCIGTPPPGSGPSRSSRARRPAGAGRVLHVRADLPATTDAAWFGYGLDWSLTDAPFNGIDRLNFTLQGPGDTRRLHNLTKIGSGSATLVLEGDYSRQEKCSFVVQIADHRAGGRRHLPVVQRRRPHLGRQWPDQRRPAAPGGPVGRPRGFLGARVPAPTWWPETTGAFGPASPRCTPGGCW